MNYDELENLNKEFAEQMIKMSSEFSELFRKWLLINPRLSIVNMIHLPMSLIMTEFMRNEVPIAELFPELPDMFIRFMKPFEKIKQFWGQVSNEDFEKMYRQEYESQFDAFFPSKKEKQNFQKWFKAKNAKK